METLPVEICSNIFRFLDYQNLAAAQQVCRKWKALASDEKLWANLFKERWGDDQAAFFSPSETQSWRHVYAVQDRCDRYGLGVKIIREGVDYYIISHGQIQRQLSSNRQLPCTSDAHTDVDGANCILDKILFFIGDLETATVEAKPSIPTQRKCLAKPST
ncbi:hypothetical protein V2J09_003525 [Rumex salicifolius]